MENFNYLQLEVQLMVFFFRQGTSKGFCDLEKLSLSCGAHAALSITNDLVHR